MKRTCSSMRSSARHAVLFLVLGCVSSSLAGEGVLLDPHGEKCLETLEKYVKHGERVTRFLSGVPGVDPEVAKKLGRASELFGKAHEQLGKGVEVVEAAEEIIELGYAVACLNEVDDTGSAGFAVGAGHLFAASGKLASRLDVGLAKYYFKLIARSGKFFSRMRDRFVLCKRYPRQCEGICTSGGMLCEELIEQPMPAPCLTLVEFYEDEPEAEVKVERIPFDELGSRVAKRLDDYFAEGPHPESKLRPVTRRMEEAFQDQYETIVALRAQRVPVIGPFTEEGRQLDRDIERAVCDAEHALMEFRDFRRLPGDFFEAEILALEKVSACPYVDLPANSAGGDHGGECDPGELLRRLRAAGE